ncbi:DUF3299 domain-containing protein [Gemmatimonas groenlandica]|uniref:DUF3299 domain-containing protein n=1 Tax=Gemmatimonas groenlandica TaxID=2732249 RepID=A0A6M4IN62_9BACT|nr:DUF3299 domain-containing protein [Gemmatimonas groenlandica]QJR36143.1 DUF3299 domain-containing protein [Gemmatimonas groenlandica]
MLRRSPVLSLAGISVVLLATTAFTTPARSTPPVRVAAAPVVSKAPTAPKAEAKASPKALVEEAVNIDWRVLAGLDYTNGKSTDTLKKLEGKLVRIPGFVVPLDDFQEEGAEFLLVPYYGACVHTPPPPPNQIVMVEMGGKKAVKLNLFDAVWMSGRLKIASVESPYGTVGYQLEGLKVEPYSSK